MLDPCYPKMQVYQPDKRFMDYSEYLQSPQWFLKRLQKFKNSGKFCECCHDKTEIHVHHLTYERIFNEQMEDLMVLCLYHHAAAEECIRTGKLPRTGDVKEIRVKTLKLVSEYKKPVEHKEEKLPLKASSIYSQIKCSNPIQESLMNQSWFKDAILKPKLEFRNEILNWFRKHKQKSKMMENCLALYQMRLRIEK